MTVWRTVDLHAHTTASDGTLTPSELVREAARIGLSAVAVTDHDTIDGLPEALRAARHAGIEVVPGVELAVEYSPGRFHMLGYFIEPGSSVLEARLQRLKDNRSRRNEMMAEKLAGLGLPVTLEDIRAESGGGQVGRPHMAAALLKKNVVATRQEAFDLYLADGAAAHVPKDKITVEEGLALIHASGGLAVLAHPDSLNLEDSLLAAELRRLRDLGLDGVECYYSQHSPARRDALLAMSREARLLATGGSDFHGATKPAVCLGQVDEGQPAPDVVLAGMKDARGRVW